MKKLIITALLLIYCFNCYSGFFSTTVHSRANCATLNESITWNAKESHWWRVKSLHTPINKTSDIQHIVDTFMAYTWRAAAYHKGESIRSDRPWMVDGYHFYLDDYGREIYDAYTFATNCNIYDGWWDI